MLSCPISVTEEPKLTFSNGIPDKPLHPNVSRGADVANQPVQGGVTVTAPLRYTGSKALSGSQQVPPCHTGVQTQAQQPRNIPVQPKRFGRIGPIASQMNVDARGANFLQGILDFFMLESQAAGRILQDAQRRGSYEHPSNRL